MRNCTRDEGGPFGVGNQVLISSHRKLLRSKALVVSVAETPGWLQARQIRGRRRASSSSTLLALRLGARSRHQGLLRQHRLGAFTQGGPPSYGPSVGAS